MNLQRQVKGRGVVVTLTWGCWILAPEQIF